MIAERITPLTLVALALAVSTGCVLPDQISGVQSDLADVQKQLGQIRAEQADNAAKLAELQRRAGEARQDDNREELADIAARLDEIARDVAINGQRGSDLDSRVRRFADDLDRTKDQVRKIAARPVIADPYAMDGNVDPLAPIDSDFRPTTLPAGGPNADATPDAQTLYNTAYADFSSGNYALAVSGFEEFVQLFPGSAQADNAMYWIGECHFSQGNFPQAVQAYDVMLERYPDSDKAAASNLKKGLAFLEQNQIGQAIVQLRFVVQGHAGSDEARIAQNKLTSLGAN